MGEATFEDLAFPNRSLRAPDGSRAARMFERSEFRSRREERRGNGVKNLKGARPSPKTLCHNLKNISFVPREKMFTILIVQDDKLIKIG